MDLRERSTPRNNRHPWELVRASFFSKKIAALTNGESVEVLDLGSGDCWFAEQLLPQLPPDSRITCCDIHFTDEDLAATTSSGIIRTHEIPLQQFDIIILLDVIEHIEFDEAFLEQQVLPRLHSQSSIVISVPAHPSLFSTHDSFLGHYRRYTRADLLRVTRKQFDVSENGYLFTSLAFVRWFQSKRNKQSGSSELGIGSWTAGNFVTFLVTSALHLDAVVSRLLQIAKIRVPGLTVWTVCKVRSPRQSSQ